MFPAEVGCACGLVARFPVIVYFFTSTFDITFKCGGGRPFQHCILFAALSGNDVQIFHFRMGAKVRISVCGYACIVKEEGVCAKTFTIVQLGSYDLRS